jgi:CBS domain-containing protein
VKVSEVMSGKVRSVGPDESVHRAADVLCEHGLTAVLVTDGEKPVGILSEGDLIRAMLPRYAEIYEDDRYLHDYEFAERRVDLLADMPVRHIMTNGVITVTEDTPVLKAAALLRLHNIKWLPVMRGERIVGMVTRRDICRGLLARRGTAGEA